MFYSADLCATRCGGAGWFVSWPPPGGEGGDRQGRDEEAAGEGRDQPDREHRDGDHAQAGGERGPDRRARIKASLRIKAGPDEAGPDEATTVQARRCPVTS